MVLAQRSAESSEEWDWAVEKGVVGGQAAWPVQSHTVERMLSGSLTRNEGFDASPIRGDAPHSPLIYQHTTTRSEMCESVT
jgi:hypothetical protein